MPELISLFEIITDTLRSGNRANHTEQCEY